MKTRTVSLNHPSSPLDKFIGRRIVYTSTTGGHEIVGTLDKSQLWPQQPIVRFDDGGWAWAGSTIKLVEEEDV